MFRAICDGYFNLHPVQIGGPGITVFVDESFLTKRKDGRGRPVRAQGQWIMGGIEQGSNLAFLLAVSVDKLRSSLSLGAGSSSKHLIADNYSAHSPRKHDK
jgi:hypothetical protein